MVNELEKSLDIALVVLNSKKFSRLSNCKMMATRMLQFQLGTISPKVSHSMKRMHQFFATTYTGLGCSICNAETHKLVDAATKTVTLSQHFCRDLTSSSLHVLLYLHIHYVKFYQLASKFMAQCDHNGNYNEQAAVPAEASIKIDEGKQQDLMACREFRNDNTWLASCGAICEEFNLTKIEETFYPHIDAFIAATKFLAERHKVISDGMKPPKEEKKPEEDQKSAEDAAKEPEKKEEKSKEERILERVKFHRDARMLEDAKTTPPASDEKAKEGGTEGADATKKEGADSEKKEAPQIPEATLPKTPEEILEDSKNPNVFLNIPKEPANLSGLKPAFEPKGANPFEDGKLSNFDAGVYSKIKEAVAAELAKTQGKEGAEQQVEKKTSSFWSISVRRLMTHCALILMATAMFGF